MESSCSDTSPAHLCLSECVLQSLGVSAQRLFLFALTHSVSLSTNFVLSHQEFQPPKKAFILANIPLYCDAPTEPGQWLPVCCWGDCRLLQTVHQEQTTATEKTRKTEELSASQSPRLLAAHSAPVCVLPPAGSPCGSSTRIIKTSFPQTAVYCSVMQMSCCCCCLCLLPAWSSLLP